MSQSSVGARVPGALLQYWWIVVIAAVLGAGGAFAYSATKTPIFHSSASIYFSMRSATSGSDINQGSAYTQNQMLSFARLATSSAVMDKVQKQLANDGLDVTDATLRRAVSVTIPQNTVVLDITAASADPEAAAAMSNSVADNLAEVVYEIAPKDDRGESTVVATVIQPGQPASIQTSPNKTQDAVLGLILGALAATLGITSWALLDRRVRSASALRQVTDHPMLGSVPFRRGARHGAAMLTSPNGSAAEAYRQVRSSLRFAGVEHDIGALAVTSSIAGEGKTTTAVNLALAYVEMGQSVLIIDADLRRPQVADVLRVDNVIGLASVLVGAVTAEDAIIRTSTGLEVLSAGEHVPNPAQLLASHRMADLVGSLRANYDLIIVDTAPVLSVADATIIAQYVDATVVLVNVRKTTLGQLERSLRALRGVGVSIAGIVLNGVREQKREKYLYTVES